MTTSPQPTREVSTVGPTVAELVATPTLGMSLLAGQRGDLRRVSWAHVSELSDPTPWLQGSELLLTTGLAVPKHAQEQRQYVRLLNDGAVSALAVSEKLYTPRLSKTMLAEADELGFPILRVSLQVPFIAIVQEVAAHTQVAAQARLVSLLRLFGTLRSIAAEQVGNRELFARLEELSGYRLAVCSRAGRALLDGVPVPPPAVIQQLPASDEAPPRIPDGYAITLPVASQVHGYLVATPRPGAAEIGLAAVQHIATIAALQLAGQLRDHEFRRRERAETLAELLSGTLAPKAASKRLADAGFADVDDLQLVAVRAANQADDQTIAHTLYELAVPHLMLSLSDLYILLPGDSSAVGPLSAVEGIRLGVSGRFRFVDGFATARRQARWGLLRAVDLGTPVSRYNDDQESGWLPADSTEQHEVVQQILGPLIEYDRTHGSHLLRSLEVWLAHDRSTNRAARALHLHPNTLTYRLRRIADMTGRDLTKTHDLVDMWLALRVWRILERPV